MSEELNPDWAVHPGELLAALINAKGCTVKAVAQHVGLSVSAVTGMVNKKYRIQDGVASGLEDFFGVKESIWLNLQATWDAFQEMKDTPWWWPAADSCGGYKDTWDHVGDARDQFQYLADAFLSLVEETGKKPSDFMESIERA